MPTERVSNERLADIELRNTEARVPWCGPDEAEFMARELQALRRFVGWVLFQHTGSIDGCEIEEEAVKLGLMTQRMVGTGCGEGCGCITDGAVPDDCCYLPLYDHKGNPVEAPSGS